MTLAVLLMNLFCPRTSLMPSWNLMAPPCIAELLIKVVFLMAKVLNSELEVR